MAIHKKEMMYILKKERLPFTTFFNSTIALIPDAAALGIYCYLYSKPEDWVIRRKDIMNRFGVGFTIIRTRLKILQEIGLLSYKEVRNKNGTFKNWEIHLFGVPQESVQNLDRSIFEVPDESVLKKDTQEYETKEENVDHPLFEKPQSGLTTEWKNSTHTNKGVLQNKDINKPIVDFDKSTKTKFFSDYKKDSRFMSWYNIYPRKQKPQLAYKAFKKLNPDDEMLVEMIKNVQNRVVSDVSWRDKQYIPHPATYINSADYDSEVVEDTQKTIETRKEKYSVYVPPSEKSHQERAKEASEAMMHIEQLRKLKQATTCGDVSKINRNEPSPLKDVLGGLKRSLGLSP